MRVAAYTLWLALIGCVLVGTLHAQDGNVFKEEDFKRVNDLQLKLLTDIDDLSTNAREHPIESKAYACLGTLWQSLFRVIGEVRPMGRLVFISSRMQSKTDE